MNYAYARVSAKDRTYSGRLPRLVSNGAELRYAPRERAPVRYYHCPVRTSRTIRAPRALFYIIIPYVSPYINFSAHFIHFYSLILRRTGQSLLPPA